MTNIPNKLNNNVGVKLSSTLSGQRELIREMRNKINELIDVVKQHRIDFLAYSGFERDELNELLGAKEKAKHKSCNGWGCEECNQTGYSEEASKGECKHESIGYELPRDRVSFNAPPVCMDCGKNLAKCNPPESKGECSKCGCEYPIHKGDCPELYPPEHEEIDVDKLYSRGMDRLRINNYIRDNFVSKEKIKRVIEESADYTKYPHYGDYKIGTFMNIFQHGLEERARVIIESLGLGD